MFSILDRILNAREMKRKTELQAIRQELTRKR
jgi:hypothetical protein